MNIFECTDWKIWKQLTDEQKREVFSPLLMYFVSPLLRIQNSRLATFELCGMKCRTFELEINGETFVFIPGQSNTILGWDLGVSGLKSHELLEIEGPNLNQEVVYGSNLSQAELDELRTSEEQTPETDLHSLEGISTYINQRTSPLRDVTIPAMLVAKKALPVGTELKGSFDCVSGSYVGKEDFYGQYQTVIQKQLMPELSFEESLTWSYPQNYLLKEQLYLSQVAETNTYEIYAHQSKSQEELSHDLSMFGFHLLTEDQWEFAVGGGTRRLFRWGNELKLEGNGFQTATRKSKLPNMFGLEIDASQQVYELTTEGLKLEKATHEEETVIEKVLPLSTYYQPQKELDKKQKLNPQEFHYRKAILIEP